MTYEVQQEYPICKINVSMKVKVKYGNKEKGTANTFGRDKRKTFLEGAYDHWPMESRLLEKFPRVNNVRMVSYLRTSSCFS